MTNNPHRRPTSPGLRCAVLIAALVETSPLAASPRGGGVTMGCFCMDGVRAQKYEPDSVHGIEGSWTPWTYKYEKKAGSPEARLIVFDRAVPPERALLGCDEIAAKAVAAGVRVILAGSLKKLDLKGRVFQSTTGGESRFQVDENQLRAELGRVVSGEQRIGGGRMQLSGARLYITNPVRLLALAEKLSGTLEIEAWNRTVTDAVLRLPGGASVTTNLSLVDPAAENLTIRLDMENGAAQLWKGHLRGAPPQPLRALSARTAAVTLSETELNVRSVRVTADKGLVTAELNDTTGTAARVSLERPTVTTKMAAVAVEWKRADSAVKQSVDELYLSELSLTDAVLRSSETEVRTDGGQVAMRGEAEARFKRMTVDTATGTVRWTRPDVSALGFLLPSGSVESVDIDVSGPLATPRLRGSAAATRFSAGPVAIADPLALSFDLTGGGAELRLPLRWKVGRIGAGVVVRDLDQTAAMTATLAGADLEGTVVLTWPELRGSRLEVPVDRFHLTLVGTVATKPLLAGTAPTFGEAQLAVVNSSAVVAGEKSSGTLKLTSDVLVLGQPILRVGEKGKESASSLKLTANGTVSAGYDLSTGKMSLLKGKFLASDIEFALLDPAGSIDLSGMVVASPVVRLRELSIDIDEEQVPKVSRASMKDLSVGAARISRPRSPAHPNEITFDAVPSRPLSISLVEAGRIQIADAVEIKAITVRALDSELRDGAAQFGGGFSMVQAVLAVKARSIASVDDGNGPSYQFDEASFAVNGRLSTAGQLHINGETGFELALVVSGPSDHLNGSGMAKIGGFTGSAVTSMPLEAACRLNLPVEYNFGTGGAEMEVLAQDGAFSGAANLAAFGLLLHSTSGASCDTSPEEIVISEESKKSMTGLCCCPLETCEWSVTIPKVALRWHKRFEIHGLAGTATLTNPRARLRDGKLQVCNLGAFSVAALPGGALIVGGVSPQIDTAVPGADAIVNPLISGLFTGLETLAATSLANGLGLVVSTIGTAAGNLQCLAQ